MPTAKSRRPKPKPEPVELLPPGILIARVEIPARAVPWKAPSTTRTGHSYKDPSLVAWQATVALIAKFAMGNRKPYAGPVRLSLIIDLKRKPGSAPDATNLQKAIEDSCQNIIFTNDRLVVETNTRRTIGDRDHVTIEVFSA